MNHKSLATRWNTGRQYTNKGQSIEAVQVNEQVYFYDRSRMITGKFETTVRVGTERELQELVMHMYDNVGYESCSISECEEALRNG